MRLFIAVRFNEKVTAKLLAATDELRKQSIRGNLTRPSNFHLTLVFLGEQPDPAVLIRALKTLDMYSFEASLGKTGRFKREGGDIVFAGFQNGNELKKLCQAVCRALAEAGFVYEKDSFIPHVTLGREVVAGPAADNTLVDNILADTKIPVNSVSLMRTERIGGQLVYSELEAVPLKMR